MQQDAHFKNIRPEVYCLSCGLFWAHVFVFAFQYTVSGVVNRSPSLGDTEVSDFDFACVNQDVGRRHISMRKPKALPDASVFLCA